MEYIIRALQYLPQHKRAITILVVLGIFFTLGVNLFFNYAVIDLSVSVPPSVKSADIQVYANHDTESSPINNIGISVIPRSTKSVTVMTKNKQMRTITTLTIPWYGIISTHTTLVTDKNADKVAFRSSLYNTCASYNPTTDHLLAFACSGNSGLTYYDTSSTDWLNNLVTKIDINNQVSPYRGGVIGLSSVNDKDSLSRSAPIEYISSSGIRHHYVFPDNFVKYDDFSQMTIVTDPTDPSSSRFILIAQGVIYLASVSTDDTVSYTTIPAPSDYNSVDNQTICTFRGVDVYCYRGAITSDDTDSQPRDFQPTIIQASFGSSNAKSFTTDVQVVDNLYVTTSGQLFSKNYKTLLHLKRVGDTYVSQQISNNVDDAQASTELYFIDDTGVLVYNTNTATATQVFRSVNVLPKHLMTTGGKVFILGYSTNDSTYTYTYAWVLTSETDNNYGNRLIDILPMFSSTSTYGDTDLVGRNINITVHYDGPATATIQQQKQTTLDYLKIAGVNTSEVTLTNP